MKLSNGIEVRFAHVRGEGAQRLAFLYGERARVCGVTLCRVLASDGGAVYMPIATEPRENLYERPGLLTGEAFCSAKDSFDERRGAKLALARALRLVPKAERAVIWGEVLVKLPKAQTKPKIHRA